MAIGNVPSIYLYGTAAPASVSAIYCSDDMPRVHLDDYGVVARERSRATIDEAVEDAHRWAALDDELTCSLGIGAAARPA